MKPIIIYQESNDNDRVNISKVEFERLIVEAYEQGKQDGAMYYSYPTTYPSTPTSPVYPTFTYSTNTAAVKNSSNNNTELFSGDGYYQ